MAEKEAPAGVGSGLVLIMAIVNVGIGASVSSTLIQILISYILVSDEINILFLIIKCLFISVPR